MDCYVFVSSLHHMRCSMPKWGRDQELPGRKNFLGLSNLLWSVEFADPHRSWAKKCTNEIKWKEQTLLKLKAFIKVLLVNLCADVVYGPCFVANYVGWLLHLHRLSGLIHFVRDLLFWLVLNSISSISTAGCRICHQPFSKDAAYEMVAIAVSKTFSPDYLASKLT